MNSSAIVDRVLAVLQEADELGGIESSDEYAHTMEVVASICSRRAQVARMTDTPLQLAAARRCAANLARFVMDDHPDARAYAQEILDTPAYKSTLGDSA